MPRDPNTCANINEITLEHMECWFQIILEYYFILPFSVNWFVDFENTQIIGNCILHYFVLEDCRKIVQKHSK